MDNKLLEQFKKGEVILYTPTFEDFKTLMEWCEKENIIWCTGTKPTEQMQVIFGEFNSENKGLKIKELKVLSYIKFNSDDLTIYPLTTSDLQPDQPTFTKSDLKIGMIVELRNETKCLVKQGCYATIEPGNNYMPQYYCDDLTRIDNKRELALDVVKVYTTSSLIEVLNGNYDSLELVWEREQEVDWSAVAVDTKVTITTESGKTFNRYFAKYEDGKVFVFDAGRTSFTNENYALAWWNKVALYKEDKSSI